MDDAWFAVYEKNAESNLPYHSMSCWTEDGFLELFDVTFKLVENLDEVVSVLDVGSGPGVYCNEFFKRGFSVEGVDYSPAVINKAKLLFPKITFKVGSAYNLDYENNSFDLVTCIGVLQCVLEPEKIISELARVSKKYILISTLLRQRKLDDPMRYFKKKLETDTWPTRDYHPSEIEDLLINQGFSVTTILKNKNKLIKDGFFIVATKL
ncbi:MAG: class I SAM-dependent methyltransferase [Candidatus Woesearchaeota archaeon]